MKSMYRLYDVYECLGRLILVGEYETLREVKRAALRWEKEVADGECDFDLFRLSDDGKYHRVDEWTY